MGLLREPRLGCGGLSVRQQGDGLSSLEVADQRPVALVAPPSPVVDADHRWRCKARAAASTHYAQQGVFAGWDHEAASEACGRATSQGQAKAVHEIIQTGGAPTPRRQDLGSEALGKNATPAEHRVAVKPPRQQHELHRPARPGQVRETASVAAMDALGRRATAWTWAGRSR